ncbi:MAG: hypothetical protein Q7S70_00215 [bacterium]|nr:hypothetical protein [bacterium]
MSVQEAKNRLEKIQAKIDENRGRFGLVSEVVVRTSRAAEHKKEVLLKLDLELDDLRTKRVDAQEEFEVALVDDVLEPVPEKL